MKRLILALSFLVSIFSINAVEFVNKTNNTLEFGEFQTLYGRKIIIFPFTLKPGEKHIDGNIEACVVKIENLDKEIYCVNNSDKDQIAFISKIFQLNRLQEDSVVIFLEVDNKIEAHKLDIILPGILTCYKSE